MATGTEGPRSTVQAGITARVPGRRTALETGALWDAIERVTGGQGGVVVLVGEPGSVSRSAASKKR